MKIIEITPDDLGFSITGQISLQVNFIENFSYLGVNEITISDRAKAYQYVFAEVEDKKIGKSILLQYEYYLPSENRSYNYPSKDIVKLGNFEWIRDNFLFTQDPQYQKPKSDTYQYVKWLEEMEYEVPYKIMSNRLVHILDDAKTHELLLIYYEPIEYSGYTWDDLVVNYESINEEIWKPVKLAFREKSMNVFEFT